MRKNNIRPTGLKGNEQVNRMRALMDMAPINESTSRSVVELTKLGPDGRIYGIVRENHEYYIKTSNNKPNLVVEDFSYIGGLKNKKDVVFESYAKAIKQLNLKFISLNEAKGIKNETDTFKNDNLINEAFDSYPEKPKASQPDTLMGTVKSPGKNDGHETEIINDSGETGNPDVSTPPVVKEDDIEEGDVVEEEDVVEGEDLDEDIELTEAEKRIDQMILEGKREDAKAKEEAKEAKEAKGEAEEAEEEAEEEADEAKEAKKEADESPILERRLSIAVALNKIDEGFNSSKKKV